MFYVYIIIAIIIFIIIIVKYKTKKTTGFDMKSKFDEFEKIQKKILLKNFD